MSAITASMRTNGALMSSLSEVRTSLVPYPRIHFLLPSFAPWASVGRCCGPRLTVSDITSSLLDRPSNLANCDMLSGKFLAIAVQYRGDIVPRDISSAIATIKTRRDVRFVDWAPTGFKCGITYLPQGCFPGGDCARITQSACMLSNSTSFGQAVSPIRQKFDSMFGKRAYVHWFQSEGMEEGELAAAREDVWQLERDYVECGDDISAEVEDYDDEY
jgi:tubulin alpha